MGHGLDTFHQVIGIVRHADVFSCCVLISWLHDRMLSVTIISCTIQRTVKMLKAIVTDDTDLLMYKINQKLESVEYSVNAY